MKSSSQSRFGFTLIELLVVISIIALLIAILLPALGAARKVAGQMQNSTQLRGIHQGLVTFANDNKNHFAGLNSSGDFVPNGANTTGNSGRGSTVEARYWILLNGDFFSPAYAVSPAETAVEVTEYTGSGDVTIDHYSYALLSIDRSGGSPSRLAEWSQTLNSQAIVVSDRGIRESNPISIHTDLTDDFLDTNVWIGSVLWNDNHVAFEGTGNGTFETRYANGQFNPDDNIFFQTDGVGGGRALPGSGLPDGDNSNPSANALLVVRGDTGTFAFR